MGTTKTISESRALLSAVRRAFTTPDPTDAQRLDTGEGSAEGSEWEEPELEGEAYDDEASDRRCDAEMDR